MPFDDILQQIRKKSREEWTDLLRDTWTDLRIWIQEHGEIAALAGIVIGMFFVLAFKLVIGLLVLVLIAGYVVWNIAQPGSGDGAKSGDGNGSGDEE